MPGESPAAPRGLETPQEHKRKETVVFHKSAVKQAWPRTPSIFAFFPLLAPSRDRRCLPQEAQAGINTHLLGSH